MANLAQLQQAVNKYTSDFRKNDIEQLVQSEIYSLDRSVDIRFTYPSLYWPDTWPLSHCRGIYAIFSHEELLYIGKASQQALGYRLSSYFKNIGSKCTIAPGHTWSSKPTHVVTWSVPENMFFEASALEEFLINYFKKEL
ncbi:MAG: GIY-YIG nuclease family protein, partial [Endozoicomonadaceae bacterium]|nr:GIY-YIG nuclease family protein [Endozoicomonadaceae bacterium]